ncbi:hypothetical protein OA867_02445 [Prochlorococcus sp. AH-716-D22]|nr:hypothetical protein [Prochlorococcus sp. AH-716-D22]
MTKSSLRTPYAERLPKIKSIAANFKANGFNRSTKHLYEDIKTSTDKYAYTSKHSTNSI